MVLLVALVPMSRAALPRRRTVAATNDTKELV
jgi:hypothetical protein